VGTVSRVINGSPQVREETRQRVLAAIEELNFSPNSAARQLSGGKTFTIGVVSPFFTFPSFVERLAGIQDVLDMSSYDLVLYSIRAPEQIARRLHTVITQNRADGLIILALPFDDGQIWLADPTLPIVVVDNIAVERYPSVVIDDIAGGQLATQYLIQQGHSAIGFIGDLIDNPFGFTSTRNRFAGFKQALADAGLPYNPDWCRFGQHSQEAARHSAHAILSRAKRPTALFVSIDTLALGVIAAANDLGLRVPDDVAIIGFDDIQAAGYSGLTTVRQHLFWSGQIAGQAMLDWLANGSLPADRWRTYMSLEIVERSTV
jgi:DNA-binding LacI/PurR family transcriptional regulator